MPRNAMHAAAKAAKPRQTSEPEPPHSSGPAIAAPDVFADLKAGTDMATAMAASYWIGLVAFGLELPLGTARSWQFISRG